MGSPLELAFLRLFAQHGFHPQTQVPVAPSPGEQPISVADFAVPERRLAIYIDGAAFHSGQHLRRDRFLRDRLRQGTPPWHIEELRAADLHDGDALVARLHARVSVPSEPDTAPTREDQRGNTAPMHEEQATVHAREATPAPNTRSTSDSAWDDILALLEPVWQPLARGLREAGLPLPDDAYWDLMDNGRVTGRQAILVWQGAEGPVALVPEGEATPLPGYVLLPVTPTSPLAAVVTDLRARLGGVPCDS